MHNGSGLTRRGTGRENKMLKTTHQEKSLARPDSGLATWNPVREFSDLHRLMDDFLSRAFGYTPLSTLIPNHIGNGHQMEADIYETTDKVIVVCPLPGFETNQINVQATEQSITITAERMPLIDEERARPYRLGYLSNQSQCQVILTLPDEINPSQISANFKNGVLQLEAPKSERAKHKSVKVNVRG